MKAISVVGVISSPNAHGNSATLVRAALAGARETGAETVEVCLPDLTIGYCSGCLQCNRTGACYQDDDFAMVRRTLQQADAIILSSPTYGGAPCARMKNLFDRLGLLEFMTSSVFGGKYIATISTAKSSGAKRTADYMASIPLGTVFQRAFVSGRLAATLKGGKTAAESPKHTAAARRLGARVADDARRGRRYLLQNLPARLLNGVMMKPMLARGIAQYKEGDMRGVYENLVRRGLLVR